MSRSPSGKFSTKPYIRKYVLDRDGWKCRDCGKPSERLEVHHIIPVYKGGTGEPANLITLCVGCHLVRHGKIRETDKTETLTEWAKFAKELEK